MAGTIPVAEPLVVYEDDGGVCAFRTVRAAREHGGLIEREVFDAGGRRLRRVEGSEPGYEVETEEDHSESIRQRVRERLTLVQPQAPADDQSLVKFLADEPNMSFAEFADELAELLKPPGHGFDPGSWRHKLVATHPHPY